MYQTNIAKYILLKACSVYNVVYQLFSKTASCFQHSCLGGLEIYFLSVDNLLSAYMLKGSFGKKSDHFFDDVFSTNVCGNSRGRKFPLLKLLSPICHRAHNNYSQRQLGRCEVSPAPTRRFPVTSNPPWRERTDQS